MKRLEELRLRAPRLRQRDKLAGLREARAPRVRRRGGRVHGRRRERRRAAPARSGSRPAPPMRAPRRRAVPTSSPAPGRARRGPRAVRPHPRGEGHLGRLRSDGATEGATRRGTGAAPAEASAMPRNHCAFERVAPRRYSKVCARRIGYGKECYRFRGFPTMRREPWPSPRALLGAARMRRRKDRGRPRQVVPELELEGVRFRVFRRRGRSAPRRRRPRTSRSGATPPRSPLATSSRLLPQAATPPVRITAAAGAGRPRDRGPSRPRAAWCAGPAATTSPGRSARGTSPGRRAGSSAATTPSWSRGPDTASRGPASRSTRDERHRRSRAAPSLVDGALGRAMTLVAASRCRSSPRRRRRPAGRPRRRAAARAASARAEATGARSNARRGPVRATRSARWSSPARR